MASSQRRAKAVAAIKKRGALLVYPINNRKEPRSIWSELFPRTKMRWEWDDEGDSKVADLWHLREQLSRSRQVVYSKWYQGRATFFANDVFTHLVALFSGPVEMGIESRLALEVLEADSPLSTKQLKAACELEGRLLEPTYNRALKPLWQRMKIVAFGEFEDSSFPSLGIAATRTIFEELYNEAANISREQAYSFLEGRLGVENPFYKFARKISQP